MTEVPILETLLHPPLGLLKRELITGTFSGAGSIDRVSGPVGVNAYGLTWDIVTIPDGYGYIIGTPTVYYERIIQAATSHVGLDSHELLSEWHEFNVEGAYWLWDNPLPHKIYYNIGVGIELALFWLVIGP